MSKSIDYCNIHLEEMSNGYFKKKNRYFLVSDYE